MTGDTQLKRGEPIPKGLLTDVNVYIKWYNERPNRAKCPFCEEMVYMKKDETGSPVVDLKHKVDCDTNTKIMYNFITEARFHYKH